MDKIRCENSTFAANTKQYVFICCMYVTDALVHPISNISDSTFHHEHMVYNFKHWSRSKYQEN